MDRRNFGGPRPRSDLGCRQWERGSQVHKNPKDGVSQVRADPSLNLPRGSLGRGSGINSQLQSAKPLGRRVFPSPSHGPPNGPEASANGPPSAGASCFVEMVRSPSRSSLAFLRCASLRYGARASSSKGWKAYRHHPRHPISPPPSLSAIAPATIPPTMAAPPSR